MKKSRGDGNLGRFVAALVGLAWIVSCSPVAADTPVDPKEPQHPRVVWKTNPAHRATIVWHTIDRGSTHKIHFGPVGEESVYADALPYVVSAQTHAEYQERAYFHYGAMTGLKPDTLYAFSVETDDRRSQRWTFRTAPLSDPTFTLLYGGDSRSDSEKRREVNRLIHRIFERRDDVLAFVHGGDYTELGMEWHGWRQWLDDHTETYVGRRQLPIIPARGNHEYSRANLRGELDNYNGIFGLPGGSDRDYWATDFGHQLTLLTLNSTGSLGGRQQDWLEAQLRRANEESRWIVANYHHPAYPAVKSPSGARVHWTPLFEEYDLDLACESDGHVLKRTVPIQEGERVSASEGVVYVGEGGLGVPQREPDRSRWYLQEPGFATAAHHVQLLTFSRERLVYRAVGLDGRVLDRWSRDARRQVGESGGGSGKWRLPGFWPVFGFQTPSSFEPVGADSSR